MAKKIEIAAYTGFTMAGSWDQRLFCTICADGTVSLRAELRGDAPTYRPKGARGIRTALQFMDGVSKATEMSSLADHIDYEQVCAALAPSRPKLADDLARLVNSDGEPELPQEIEKTIGVILTSKGIYPSTCRTSVDRRIRYERTRRVLIDHYLLYGQLPDGPIAVDGHQIASQELEPHKERSKR
jgi:hypothetical protein